jgi:CheY-like chemotaxis protein
MGHRLDTVTNGGEAIDAASDQDYDVILMDLQMPKVDGLEATKRLRNGHASAKSPYIIALTASVTESDRNSCLAAGMDAFLSKPVKQEDLAEAINRARA